MREDKIIHVVIMSHLEGDAIGDPTRGRNSRIYQTRGLPSAKFVQEDYKKFLERDDYDIEPFFRDATSFELDLTGLELVRELCQNYTDAWENHPKPWVGPVGMFWQTEADPVYGGKLFRKYEFIQKDGYEFGIQCHAVVYGGTCEDDKFYWPPYDHTLEGKRRKLADTHRFAETVCHHGRKVNAGYTLTAGYRHDHDWRIPGCEKKIAEMESIYDHIAYELGYRASLDGYGSYEQDWPAEVNRDEPCPFVYLADYRDGTKMIKLNLNGVVSPGSRVEKVRRLFHVPKGSKEGFESIEQCCQRFDRTVAAMEKDNPRRVYFFAFGVHPPGVYEGSLVPEREMEYGGFLGVLDHIQEATRSGIKTKFVTPKELSDIFLSRQS